MQSAQPTAAQQRQRLDFLLEAAALHDAEDNLQSHARTLRSSSPHKLDEMLQETSAVTPQRPQQVSRRSAVPLADLPPRPHTTGSHSDQHYHHEPANAASGPSFNAWSSYGSSTPQAGTHAFSSPGAAGWSGSPGWNDLASLLGSPPLATPSLLTRTRSKTMSRSGDPAAVLAPFVMQSRLAGASMAAASGLPAATLDKPATEGPATTHDAPQRQRPPGPVMSVQKAMQGSSGGMDTSSGEPVYAGKPVAGEPGSIRRDGSQQSALGAAQPDSDPETAACRNVQRRLLMDTGVVRGSQASGDTGARLPQIFPTAHLSRSQSMERDAAWMAQQHGQQPTERGSSASSAQFAALGVPTGLPVHPSQYGASQAQRQIWPTVVNSNGSLGYPGPLQNGAEHVVGRITPDSHSAGAAAYSSLPLVYFPVASWANGDTLPALSGAAWQVPHPPPGGQVLPEDIPAAGRSAAVHQPLPVRPLAARPDQPQPDTVHTVPPPAPLIFSPRSTDGPSSLGKRHCAEEGWMSNTLFGLTLADASPAAFKVARRDSTQRSPGEIELAMALSMEGSVDGGPSQLQQRSSLPSAGPQPGGATVSPAPGAPALAPDTLPRQNTANSVPQAAVGSELPTWQLTKPPRPVTGNSTHAAVLPAAQRNTPDTVSQEARAGAGGGGGSASLERAGSTGPAPCAAGGGAVEVKTEHAAGEGDGEQEQQRRRRSSRRAAVNRPTWQDDQEGSHVSRHTASGGTETTVTAQVEANSRPQKPPPQSRGKKSASGRGKTTAQVGAPVGVTATPVPVCKAAAGVPPPPAQPTTAAAGATASVALAPPPPALSNGGLRPGAAAGSRPRSSIGGVVTTSAPPLPARVSSGDSKPQGTGVAPVSSRAHVAPAHAVLSDPEDPPDSKANHPQVERNRRDAINTMINELRVLVPAKDDSPVTHYVRGDDRRPKHAVLSETIQHIWSLRRANEQQVATIQTLQATHQQEVQALREQVAQLQAKLCLGTKTDEVMTPAGQSENTV